MTHYGILCPPAIGHLNPICALGNELKRRGHRVTLFQVAEMENKLKTTGLEFQEIGAAEYEPGEEESYKQNALKLQTAIRNAGGVKSAADIIEKAVTTREPVLVQR